ncbi:GtrA family protein [Leadbettera azotonutricia]|uniref:Conserved membrane protein, GtcA family n=1 Tax=Leadbettera azotonutricia (strain ATCC BAA-888 / DSM 13862 / ZAS-9) TaxID=545695 RepID=F5Y773_LEAAZ|nr:GtrA family protein [Leadbettera azotonutricia]AEF82102.1 conserved membrane protein, GtcA family [Leadbettera azotonutricia ZAS-9]
MTGKIIRLIKENAAAIKQFIGFCIVGVSNTLISLAIYYAMVYLGVHYQIANVVSYVISIFNAYFWNRWLVFKKRSEPRTGQLIRTYISYGFTLGLSALLLYILVDVFNISSYIAPIIILFITTPVNFLLNKFWTFREPKNSPPAAG